jgi:hypothetical protein
MRLKWTKDTGKELDTVLSDLQFLNSSGRPDAAPEFGALFMPLIDLDRLDAYRRLLALPIDPTIKDQIGHRVTQPGQPLPTLIADLKNKFVRHLMVRQLERDGDL